MSHQSFETNQAANVLMERWSNHISAVNEAIGEDLSLDRKLVLATCLENTKTTLDRAGQMFESTQPSDVGPFKKFAFELVTAVVPNLIATDIVSVQPMNNRIGEIRYLKYLYGSQKGNINAGTEFSSAFGLGNTNPNYSSEVVEEEMIESAGDDNYSGNLAYVPVRPGSVVINTGATNITDNGMGALSATGVTGTINYATGAYVLAFAANTTNDITASYSYQLDYATSGWQVPQVDIKIDTLPIVAKSRKLRALYAFDAAFDMQRDYGVDINTSLVSQIAAEIKHEIDGEIMNDLMAQAGATLAPISFGKTPTTGVSLKEHYDGFYTKVIEASNAIFNATKRASATFVVVGTGAANIVESMSNFRPTGAVNPIGPHLSGYLNNTIPVYKNPYYDANAFLVGYKGQGLFDAGYVYAPYQPIMTTSLVMLDDFVGRRGFATSYGKKMVNSKLYANGVITP